jgi:hypothetical protein
MVQILPVVTQPVNKSLLLWSQNFLNSWAFDLYLEPNESNLSLNPLFL